MSGKRKREYDIDEETESRKTTTLDILNDHPFLSKQIQAAVNLRNTPISSDFFKSYRNNKSGILDILTNFIKGNVERYFSGILEFNTFQNNDKTHFNITSIGTFAFTEWMLKRDRELDPNIFNFPDPDYLERHKRMMEWQELNPPPECLETTLELDIYQSEINRFLKRFQNVLLENGIEFNFEDVGKYDGITRMLSFN